MSREHEAAPVAAAERDPADETLLERVAGGDPDALSELYERYRTVTYSVALKITANPSAAEDVVQEAFLGVWRNASRYVSARGSVKTWILAIVHHRAIDSLRRRRPTSELPESDAPPPTSLVLPDIWPEVAGRLDRDAIAAALATLSPIQREALELAYYGGLTQQEIAARTGAPLGTVKSRVRLGLLAMRAALTGENAGARTGAEAEA
jgi:RNA polymerase sigma-70 factor (ECF subfamily)